MSPANPLTNQNARDISLIELWNTTSPINLDDEEQSYIDFTKEYRRYDEAKFSAF